MKWMKAGTSRTKRSSASLSLDCAEKATERSDFTAATVWAETTDNKHYLVHASRSKEFTEMVAWIEELANGTYCGVKGVAQILVEDRGAGTQYIQRVARRPLPKPFPCHPIAYQASNPEIVPASTGSHPCSPLDRCCCLRRGCWDWIADVEAGNLVRLPCRTQ